MDFTNSASDRKNDKDKIESLAVSAQNNNKFAFVELTGIFSPFITSLARSYNMPVSEFDDLCQEGRIALYRAVCKYDVEKLSFTAFAKTCIKNAMTSFVRNYCTENKISSGGISLDSTATENLALTADDITPEDSIIAREFISELESAIDTKLSVTEKRVLKYKLSGIGTAEISVIVGKDTKSIENTLFRARKKLRDYLGRD